MEYSLSVRKRSGFVWSIICSIREFITVEEIWKSSSSSIEPSIWGIYVGFGNKLDVLSIGWGEDIAPFNDE